MLGLGVAGLVAVALSAVVVGFSKTSVGGAVTLAVAAYATVLPARESTAALLLVLVVGDVTAVSFYRRTCDWRILLRLLPWVLPGLVVGALFIARVDDTTMRRTIGLVLLVLVGWQLAGRVRPGGPRPPTSRNRTRALAPAAGVAAGFATMVANAAGAVMTTYFIAAGYEKRLLIGTSAWMFLVVNLAKLPFSVGLGLLSWDTVLLTVCLAPLVVLGAWIGVRVVGRIDQRQFEVAALTLTGVGAVLLLV